MARWRRSTSIERLGNIVGSDAIYVAGVGQHQMWAAQFISYEQPYTWLNSGGLGTMGYAVPAAMGAKVGRPDTTVWAIDGDGCFQMTNQELATCAIEGIPIKVAVINNGSLGMVRQWQTLFYEERYSNTDLHTGLRGGSRTSSSSRRRTAASGCAASAAGDVDATIEKAMSIDDVPVVIDFVVHGTRWCGRWCRPGRATTTSRSPAARRRPGTTGVGVSKHTLSVLVENKPGVLARIAGLFARRGFNIDSLAVGPTEHPACRG